MVVQIKIDLDSNTTAFYLPFISYAAIMLQKRLDSKATKISANSINS